MIIEFYCPICMELYQNTDCAFTTQCGHVFHENCLRSWLLRSTTCPECRRDCSSTSIFKVYIKSRNSEQVVEIQKQLDKKVQTIQELEDKLSVAELEQLQFIRDKEFSKVLSECLENEINEKSLEIKKLREDLECKEKNNTVQPSSSEKVPEKKDSAQSNESEIVAKKDEIIKDLEKKLAEKSLELEKEIRNSTMLIVDKMKLQQQLIDAGISGAKNNKLPVAVGTNNLNHQIKKSLQNANTTLTGAAGGADNANGATKKRLDKTTFDLFTYAKKLHKIGFKAVFFHEEKIYVRKDDAAEKIQIFSKNQVDALFRHFKPVIPNTSRFIAAPKPTQCDENYYAL